MRVAIVCGAGIISGKEVMALQLGEGLRQSGVEVYFVTSHWGSGEFGRAAETAGFPMLRLWLGFISATLRLACIWMTLDQFVHWPALFRGFSRFLRDKKPDRVIHTNWQHALLLWPLLKEKRDIFWLHETLPDTRQYRFAVRLLGKRVGSFVAVSEAAGQSAARLGIPAERVRTIRNGIEDPVPEGNAPKSEAPVIGIVGQVGPWKGHDDLLNAFAIVRRFLPEARLEIFGEGIPGYEAKLRRRISDSGMDGAVAWQGFVKDKRLIYPRLRVLVVPSRNEDPLPTSAIEAAFFGVPVVGSRRGGLPEIIEDGETGWLFAPGNIAQLSDKITGALTRPAEYQRVSANSRNRAVTHFSRERFVRQFVDVLTNPAQ